MDNSSYDKPRPEKPERSRVLRTYPEAEEEGKKLLEFFFSEQRGPVDLVVMLDGGLGLIKLLAPYIESNNMLFFRPMRSYVKEIDGPFMRGKPNLEHKVLICDDDMLTGASLRETKRYLLSEGYPLENIHAYVHLGMFCKREKQKPLLGTVNEVLDYHRKKEDEIVKL